MPLKHLAPKVALFQRFLAPYMRRRDSSALLLKHLAPRLALFQRVLAPYMRRRDFPALLLRVAPNRFAREGAPYCPGREFCALRVSERLLREF